ncbi:hypothetical protein I549_3391 [Mycobacterium avium subsp. avium 2285 (R)]|nr:hypothetical protein L839_4601 [Mycobacterium avium MAV_120809_2495]ETZ40993.1 hypothetical protein L838_5274 [Mycobacterium avium MAV_120709_2344]ETZ51340.1 hypothetical protein L837_2111 [Mycobacterium avium MAV_061107_1842]ETZ72576.1 hypothetical protein L841_0766 [Mycobacterium sp. MAC_080597_8934]EUA39924.1 hypothetical protein I549_3391 [Mycobacterium avium subsp. avium 2285 (R)]
MEETDENPVGRSVGEGIPPAQPHRRPVVRRWIGHGDRHRIRVHEQMWN